jgi:3-isopropylmalate dehydrogenase
MFEPIHGSAPKYKGMNQADPLATIWAGAMMLDEIGQEKSGKIVVDAIQEVLRQGKIKTKDLGGKNTCSDMGDAVVNKIKEINQWRMI